MRLGSSLAGRLVLLLTAGMALAALVSMAVAQHAHIKRLAHLRMESAASMAEDMFGRFSIDPRGTEAMLHAGLERRIRLEAAGAAITTPSPVLTARLQTRLGPAAQALGQVKPHEMCFGSPRDGTSPYTWGWGEIPDCWLVTFVDRHQAKRRLLIGLPRYLTGGEKLVDPTYLTLIVILSAALASLAAYLVVRPLRQLTAAAEAFSLAEDPKFLAESGPADVRAAIATFNLMQQRVSEGHRERTGILAAISHDLQTPLTRLRLRLDEVADGEVRARLEKDVAAMQSIVREGLELARSSDNREPWSIVDVDSLLTSIAADAVEIGATVEIGQSCAAAISTKLDAITRCVTNLVDNAVKYGGVTRIDCAVSPAALEIRISDNGPGIPPDKLARMFEPFARGEQSRSRSTGGTGLGLTIARAQAKLIRGEVLLENRPEGGMIATLRIDLRNGAAGRAK